MGSRTTIVALSILSLIAPSLAFSDNVNLTATYGTSPGSVNLSWTGAPPNYQIYRATAPSSLTNPSNQVLLTGFPTWTDAEVPSNIFYYTVLNGCTPNPPEICNGLDDDCDGIVDGPGSEVSCHLANAMPACV